MVSVMSARMKKLDPPVKSVILSNWSHQPGPWQEGRGLTWRVQAMAKPIHCQASVMRKVMVRLYGSMISCGAIVLVAAWRPAVCVVVLRRGRPTL